MLDQTCGEVDLTPVQAHALGEIKLLPMSVNQLAEQLLVDKSNASRTVKRLENLGLVQLDVHCGDKRRQIISVTAKGETVLHQLDCQQSAFFSSVLATLSENEADEIRAGCENLIKGLVKACQHDRFVIRPLCKTDNPYIAQVIRDVSAEYGLTADKGYGVADPTLDDMYGVYSQPNCGYWVVELAGKIIGGGGFAPLKGRPDVCELQKMYFLPSCRGQGLAKRIINMVEQHAVQLGFTTGYLETTACLKEAISLYEKLGYRPLSGPLGNTGHDACEVVMAKDLIN
ncbi:MarR family transcriptional regulator [Vibrio viridaestus]|uniref:MarR family transcriptional regulator n=2 Tax=Vibrio viridaestus TaxID=2487322 RepID=A0A3N9TME6_9VIBR|nr:MarR family transcriptional regulator [Vibrio viridaestus]